MSKIIGEPYSKFKLTVPRWYDHNNFIDFFVKKVSNLSGTVCIDKNLNSKNFNEVSYKLQPGEKCDVEISPVLAKISNEEVLKDLLKPKSKSLLVGAHGLLLAGLLKKEKFPLVRQGVSSLDRENNLWKDFSGIYKLPYIIRSAPDEFYVGVYGFRKKLKLGDYIIRFFPEGATA